VSKHNPHQRKIREEETKADPEKPTLMQETKPLSEPQPPKDTKSRAQLQKEYLQIQMRLLQAMQLPLTTKNSPRPRLPAEDILSRSNESLKLSIKQCSESDPESTYEPLRF
jgi:hypothetical protein